MTNRSDLSKVKKGDALAVLRQERFHFPYRSVKVIVTKKNPKSVVFTLEGKEHRVDLDGHGMLHGYLEVWDEAEHERRELVFKESVACDDLMCFRRPNWETQRLLDRLKPDDLLRAPELWEEIKIARDEYEAKVKNLVERLEQGRT